MWGPDGIVIYQSPRYTDPLRSSPKILTDGAGGGIIIWSSLKYSGELEDG